MKNLLIVLLFCIITTNSFAQKTYTWEELHNANVTCSLGNIKLGSGSISIRNLSDNINISYLNKFMPSEEEFTAMLKSKMPSLITNNPQINCSIDLEYNFYDTPINSDEYISSGLIKIVCNRELENKNSFCKYVQFYNVWEKTLLLTFYNPHKSSDNHYQYINNLILDMLNSFVVDYYIANQ